MNETVQIHGRVPNVYYMRDNHTFRRLSTDPAEALLQLKEEFEAGWTWGLLGIEGQRRETLGASGDWEEFKGDAMAYLRKASKKVIYD